MAGPTYLEDFFEGSVLELGTYEVTREEIIDFARKYDPQPFHTDDEAAKKSIYSGLIASGWQTCAIMMRLVCDGLLKESGSLGSPGVDGVRWLKPVRPGDVLRGRMTVTETRASASKPDRGVVKSRWDMYNQNDELVMTLESLGMYPRRPGGA